MARILIGMRATFMSRSEHFKSQRYLLVVRARLRALGFALIRLAHSEHHSSDRRAAANAAFAPANESPIVPCVWHSTK